MVKYDSYKDSGVEWIGEIPVDWKVSKLKYVSDIVTGNTPPTKDENNYKEGTHLWVKPNEIKGLYPTNDTKEKLTDKGKLLSRVLPPYSILVNGIGRIGEFGYSELSVSTNQQINSIVFNHHFNKRYGLYHTFSMKEEFLSNSEKVVVPILNKTRQENLKTVLPPIQEQQQIVSFLDIKISLIDSLIEKTQKKIKLLKEKRTSLINHTVTKGLNPDVEMKDSGVEWIGEIPSHWENRNGTTIGLYSKGKGIKKDEVKDSGNPCVRYGEIYTKYNHIVKDVTTFIDDETTETSISINTDSLLLTGSGETKEEIGKCIVYTGSDTLWIGGDIIIIKPKNDLYSVFLSYLINSECIRVQREMSGKGEIIVHIYSKNFKEMRYPIPPISEQQQIVEYLDGQTNIIDTTITKEQKRIKLLKEYRQSLISEVVTGKIKVSD